MFACDVHSDNFRAAVSGHRGTHIFDMNSGEQLFKIERGCFWVKFMEQSNRIVYAGLSAARLLRHL